jgi:hypothetical protein
MNIKQGGVNQHVNLRMIQTQHHLTLILAEVEVEEYIKKAKNVESLVPKFNTIIIMIYSI